MTRRHLTPKQWRQLPRVERAEMLAYERWRERERGELLEQAVKLKNEVGVLAQFLILLDD